MLAHKRARELFDYRHDGSLIWKISKGTKRIGSVAGTFNQTVYSDVKIDGKQYKAHRLIWLWHHGYMPEGDLDHINRVKSDNRIENLREVSRSCNMRNRGNYKTNKSGVKGVYTCKGLGNVWVSHIAVNGKLYKLGYFKCFDEAVLTRLAAEQCLNWDGCDSSSPAYMYAVNNGLIRGRQ